MPKYSVGDKVIVVSSNEKGVIIGVRPPRRGRQMYVVRVGDHDDDRLEGELAGDVNLSDPFERCKRNIYSNYNEYLKLNTTFKIQSSNNSTLSSLKASKTRFRAYQFKPLLKFLNSDNRRVLIADEVGLGKTIEAGHIMLELKARGELKNVLVICPKSLKKKWEIELNEKFGLGFMDYEDKNQLMRELKEHDGSVKGIINYDAARVSSDLVAFVREHQAKFSLVVCDESHRLRNNTTQIYHGLETILQQADAAVFMTATPIMIDENNLYNQLKLLDNVIYDQYEVFQNNLQLNRPFVTALSQLNKGVSLPQIKHDLFNATVYTTNTIDDVEFSQEYNVKEYFEKYPVFKQIEENLDNEDTPKTRAQLQFDLSEMSPMNKIFSRTRKREVTQDESQATRKPHTVMVSLYSDEEDKADSILEEYEEEHEGKLGIVTLKREMASSVYAFMNDYATLDRGFDEYAECRDAKFDKLLAIIKEVFENESNQKIIVFAIFKNTLKYLSVRLNKAGYANRIIFGPTKDRQGVLQEFKNNRNIKVLLSSEVGSEGLDMQFCHSMVNYDLPWNPMVVEQRIGRIDRFGQKSPIVNIYTLIVKGSILEEIYERLLKRIGIFRSSIGDLEAILDAPLEKAGGISIQEAIARTEHEFYTKRLTKEEREQKMDEIARAIENEKLNIEKLEEGLTNCLTNDAYFQNEINKILYNNSYVTGKELYDYLRQMLKEHLTTCRLEEAGNQIYKLCLPKANANILINFICEFHPVGRENEIALKKFNNDIREETEILLTFDQDTAFEHPEVHHINIYESTPKTQTAVFFQQ